MKSKHKSTFLTVALAIFIVLIAYIFVWFYSSQRIERTLGATVSADVGFNDITAIEKISMQYPWEQYTVDQLSEDEINDEFYGLILEFKFAFEINYPEVSKGCFYKNESGLNIYHNYSGEEISIAVDKENGLFSFAMPEATETISDDDAEKILPNLDNLIYAVDLNMYPGDYLSDDWSTYREVEIDPSAEESSTDVNENDLEIVKSTPHEFILSMANIAFYIDVQNPMVETIGSISENTGRDLDQEGGVYLADLESEAFIHNGKIYLLLYDDYSYMLLQYSYKNNRFCGITIGITTER